MSIYLLDIGISNLKSVCNTLDFLNTPYKITNKPEEITSPDAKALIMPGVGTFAAAMEELKKQNLVNAVKDFSKTKPLLGICLGMQLLFETSEESLGIEGLSILKGEVKKMSRSKLPTIGWCETQIVQSIPYFNAVNNLDFYYIHSYSCIPSDSNIISMKVSDGVVCGVRKENIFGYQFHPEKSQQAGLDLIKSFLEYAKYC